MYPAHGLTPEFLAFYRKEKSRITKTLTNLGCTDIRMNRGFYYYSGFFTSPTGQFYYFSICDVRWPTMDGMLYRRVKDYKDFKGQCNQYCNKDLSDIRIF